MRLVDQWAAVEERLPDGWDSVRLTLETEQPDELQRAAQVLGPMGAGRVDGALVLDVRRAGGPASPEAARRLFSRLDRDRVWCELSAGEIATRPSEAESATAETSPLAAQWDDLLSRLPADWSDLACELRIGSSALLPRAALLGAPLNPVRDPSIVGFTFRCAQRAGYGVSAAMARRSLERLDGEGISGRVALRGVLSDTRNVATQGAVRV
jgi:hypothetical protein